MYNGIFYHQCDFQHPDDEETLNVYWSNQDSAFHEDSDLCYLMTHLRVETKYFRVEFDEIKEDDSWSITEGRLGILKDWKRTVSHHLTSPLNHQRFDLSSIEKGWIVREQWNNYLWIGVGRQEWIVVEWRTTA